MLDIKEIQKKLDAGEIVYLEHNVRGKALNELYFSELEKLEVGYVNINENGLRDGVYIKDGSGHVRNSSYFIPKEELKYFRIKRPVPTLDDLIGVAVNAVREDKLHKFTFNKSLGNTDIIWLYTLKDDSKHFTHDQAQCGIDFINSLYTETFVIEGDSDIERLCDGAKITLTNNEKGVFNIISGSRSITNTVTGAEIMGLNTFWLKGATVTQKRGAL